MKRLITILALCLFLAGCDDSGFKTEFTALDTVRLEVNGSVVFMYDPLTCQLGYDSSKGEFRVHTDDMSDFFTLTLPHLPTSTSEFVNGDISWTTSTSIVSKKNVTLETIRLEGDMIWLWNRGSRIALAVRILN